MVADAADLKTRATSGRVGRVLWTRRNYRCDVDAGRFTMVTVICDGYSFEW